MSRVLIFDNKSDNRDEVILLNGEVASLAECMREDTGIVSPQIVDRNKNEGFVPSGSIVPVKRVITSGALVRLDVWQETGGFDERIFVDWADYEFCANVRAHGYRIVRDMRTMILHEMGRREYVFTLPTPKGGRPFLFAQEGQGAFMGDSREEVWLVKGWA